MTKDTKSGFFFDIPVGIASVARELYLARMAEDRVGGVNELANLFLRAHFSFRVLGEILEKDEHLQQYAKKFLRESKSALPKCQSLLDYLHQRGERLVLQREEAEDERYSDFDMGKAAHLEEEIRRLLRRLQRTAKEELDEELQEALKIRPKKKREKEGQQEGAKGQRRKITNQETKIRFSERMLEIVHEEIKEAAEGVPLPDMEDGEDSSKENQGQAFDEGASEDIEVSEEVEELSSREEETLKEREGPEDKEEAPYEHDEERASRDEVIENYKVSSKDDEEDPPKDEVEMPKDNEEVPSKDDKEILKDNEEAPPKNDGEMSKHNEAHSKNESDDNNPKPADSGFLDKEDASGDEDDKDFFTPGKTHVVDHVSLEMPMELKLRWERRPRNILLVKKMKAAPEVDEAFVQLVEWLKEELDGVKLFIESSVLEREQEATRFKDKLAQLCHSIESDSADDMDIDLVVSVGGDGTMLHAASLFPGRMPPVAGFKTGTLNFLVPFCFEKARAVMRRVVAGEARVNLRSRLECVVHDGSGGKSKTTTALNEIAVTRGANPNLCKVQVLMDGQSLASVAGDGLLVCTPTGSTAYALAAGGSVLHPAVPCMQIVPIAPHTICGRPIVVPQGAGITFQLEDEMRGSAHVFSDGRDICSVAPSEKLVISASGHPVPILHGMRDDPDGASSWLKSFHWCRKLEAPKTSVGKPLDDCAVCTLDIGPGKEAKENET